MMNIMKKGWPIRVLIFVAIVGGTLAIKYLPSIVPYWQCSEVYKRYAHTKGIRATYIKNYPLNDTLTVGVTLLEATTDSGWARLQEGFGIIPYPPEVLAIIDTNAVETWFAPKDDLSKPMDSILTNNDIIAVHRNGRKVAIFEIVTEQQINSIFNYNVEHLKNKK
jgi:hypothetical protein